MKVGDLLGRYKPAEKTVSLGLDGSIQSRIDEVEQRLKQARRTEKVDGLSSRVGLLEKELMELRAEADKAAAIIKLRAIPGEDFDALKLKHQPTAEDFKLYREIQQARPYLDFSPVDVHHMTFDPALIGLSICEIDGEEVDWDEEDGQRLWDGLHDGARKDLAEAAWEVNGKTSSRPLSETATDTTSSSEPESTTPATEESPSLRLAEGS